MSGLGFELLIQISWRHIQCAKLLQIASAFLITKYADKVLLQITKDFLLQITTKLLQITTPDSRRRSTTSQF